MAESQKILIDSYTAFTKLLSQNELLGIIINYKITLSYKDFLTALQSQKAVTFIKCDMLLITSTEAIKEKDRTKITCKLTFESCIFSKGLILQHLSLGASLRIYKCECKYLRIENINLLNKTDNISLSILYGNVIETITLAALSGISIDIQSKCRRIIKYDNVSNPIKILNIEDNTLEYENWTFFDNQFNTHIVESLQFKKCTFKPEFLLEAYANDILKDVKILSCQFNKIANFKDKSLKTISLYDSTFNDKLLIIDSRITALELINCSFENTVKIVNPEELISNINIERSTIKGMFLLNAFGEGKRINLTDFISNVSFKHLFVEATGYLIIRQITNGKFIFDYANILGHIVMQELDIDSLQMHNASIIGSLIVQDIKLKELDLKNTSLIGKLVFNPSDTLNIFDSNIIQNRETAYLLKKGKQEEGDSISASHFKRKELQLYLKDCTSNFNPNKVKECIVLLFNKISNDFGQSWVRGIIFTMSFAYIFYLLINFYGLEKTIFRFAWSLEGFGTAWKEYLKILNVLNFNDKLDNFKFTALGETLFFASKIFVSYGIYQTVSAFRKFGK